MRKPIMIGNWKMNKGHDEALQFIYAVNQVVPSNDVVQTVICAQSITLRSLVKRQGEDLKIGAQNMHFSDSGAFTGEVSPKLLADTGVEYVLLGHSERREMFNETDEAINKKVEAALNYNITPVVCCGETLQQREANEFESFVTTQITNAYKNIKAEDVTKTIIAYEPIWAIGTGVTATPEVADESCGVVRGVIAKLYGAEVASQIRVLYGGSVNAKNIDDLMSRENIDGGLVGGASLDAESFLTLVKACK